MRHASGVLTHASCVRRPDSCVRRQASGVRRQASGVLTHASGVRRQAFHVTAAPFSYRRLLPVMTTTGTAAIYPCATALRFAPIELYGMG